MGAPRSTSLFHTAPRNGDTIDCLTPDEAFAYVAGSAIAPRAIEVQAHLDECEICRIVVGEAARARTEWKAAVENRAPNSRRRTLSPGELIADRYQVVRFVACGGMGEVYEAVDTTRNEVVALKTLVLTALDDTRAIARLRREVKLARSVEHPNVCRILEFGEHRPPTTGEAIPFLTMDFLRGETLADRIARERRLPETEVARLLEQILAGVAAVHAAGIVHRDIKPQNILILQGPPERAVVMDFGLARALRLTRSAITGSLVVGTADYMAPEQIQGHPANPRFDVYALGVVIFEMLTGRKPFIGDTIQVGRARLAGTLPPRPSEVLPELGPKWDELVSRCLAPKPEQRFARVQDIASKLRQVFGTSRWSTRRARWGSDALAALAAIAVLVAVVYLKRTFQSQAPSAPSAQASMPSSMTAIPPVAASVAATVSPAPSSVPSDLGSSAPTAASVGIVAPLDSAAVKPAVKNSGRLGLRADKADPDPVPASEVTGRSETEPPQPRAPAPRPHDPFDQRK